MFQQMTSMLTEVETWIQQSLHNLRTPNPFTLAFPHPSSPPQLNLPHLLPPTSTLLLLPKLTLLLRRLCLLLSSGSCGCSPLALANRFRISVKLTTPDSLPLMWAPGRAAALTEGVVARGRKGGEAWGRVGAW